MKELSDFPKFIKTKNLVLRTIAPTIENATNIFNIIEHNRDYLEAWQGHFGMLKNADDVLEYLKKRSAQIETNQGVMFGIYSGNTLIGRIRFFIDKNNGCEIGYWLVKSENGKGYMSEALSALETELFKFGFDAITLEIDDGNTKSEGVAKRNGYKFSKRQIMDSWAKCVGKCDTLVYKKTK